MIPFISPEHQEETTEEKERWFQSLSVDESMELLYAFTEMILSISPKILEQNLLLDRLKDVFASLQKWEASLYPHYKGGNIDYVLCFRRVLSSGMRSMRQIMEFTR